MSVYVAVQPQESHPSLHVHPVPHVGIPFQPKLDHRVTEPQPFSFEVRDKLKAVEKEEKIKQVYEEEKKVRKTKPHFSMFYDNIERTLELFVSATS